MATRRISDEPAYVLHRYDWSESSLILEVFTRNHGRVAVIAKGAKRPTSALRPVLLPLQRLHLGFGADAEIRTLRSAEWQGGHVMPTGEALLSGYYLNELLLTLLAREDPHPRLFDIYAGVVQVLAAGQAEVWQAGLRAFELLLLREIGLLPALNMQTLTLQPLVPGDGYCLVPEAGLRLAHGGDRHRLEAEQWLQVQACVADDAALNTTLAVCAQLQGGLKPMLRTLLHHHAGGVGLRTRQMMVDLQTL